MKIFDRDGNPVSIGTVVGRGGEAVVYHVIGHRVWLAKIYEPAPRPNYAAKLAWMVDHPPRNPTHSIGHPSLAWPAGLLYDQEKRLAGYLMPHIKRAVPVLVVFNPRRRKETLPQFDRRYLHRAARNLATAISTLHASGYVVGDLNESNVLVTPSALVSLIDTDSFQVQEQKRGRLITYACPVAKPEYTPPELQGKSLPNTVRSIEQDAFSLGVLIFQLLMEGNHPFRAQWLGKGDPPPIEERIAMGAFPYTADPGAPVRKPNYAPDLDLLNPEISELFRRCFIDGHHDPHLRPHASDWERVIAEAEKRLVQCPNQHFYAGHLPACPICHARRIPARGSAYSSSATGSTSRTAHSASQNASSAASSQIPPTPTPNPQSQHEPGPYTGQRPAGTTSIYSAHAGTASSGSPAGQGTSSYPRAGSTGGVASGIKKTQQVWEAFKYWRSQQSQAQQTGTGYRPYIQGVIAAWKTWKYWQSRQAQGQPLSQSFQPAQPPPVSPTAQAQTTHNPAATQSSGSTAQTVGAHGMHPVQWQGAYTVQPQPPRPVQYDPGPQRIRSSSSQPVAVSSQPANSLLNWAGPRLYKSLAIGGGLGALVGAFSGALIGIAGWLAGNMVSWVLLWAIGGAAAGVLRGWRPGYRVSLWVDRSIGWNRFWPAFGVLAGAGLGGFVGLAVGWWAILPVFVGLWLGGWLGRKAGQKLWLFGVQFGWERIWAGVAALVTGLLGWQLASWLGAGNFSTQLSGIFSDWIASQSASLVVVSLTIGAMGGALGGIVTGTLADLFARLFNLLD